MTAYATLRLVHVVVAVLGTGAVAAIAITARTMRHHTGPLTATPIPALATWSTVSLVTMLVTGAWIDLEMHGVFHEALWFRASAISLVATGATVGILRRQIAHARKGQLTTERALARIARLAVVASVLVLAIAVLMERRPT